jgi:N4-gp56 family major capsid protein
VAATTTATLTSSVVAAHLQTEFLIAASAEERWDQFAWVPEGGAVAPGTDGTATSIQIPIYKNLALVTSTIAEATDIEGVQLADTSIAVSMGEYGNAAQDTKRLRAVGRTDIPSAFQQVIGRNAGLSQDAIARATFISGTLCLRPTPSDTRADLDTTNDVLSKAGYQFLYALAAQLRSAGAPGLGTASEAAGRAQGNAEPTTVDYGTVVSDLVTGEFLGTNGFTPLQYISSPDARQQMYNGEFGRIAGIRIIESPLGKIYQSAGTVAQAATSLTAAATVGQTSLDMVSATGLAVGDYWTLGTVETGTTETTTLETVLVTSVATTIATIIGAGPDGGLRYAHAAADPVTEAVFVGAIPVFGGMSVAKAYSTLYGPKPAMIESGPFDKLGRFKNYGWLWMGGYHVTIPTWLARGEIALTNKSIMAYGT